MQESQSNSSENSNANSGEKPSERKALVMSGMRVTSPQIHIGNYFGALKNWIRLQNDFPCIFGVMDWHGMTSAYRSSKEISLWRKEMMADFVAWGVNPEESVVFIQSQVPEIIELYTYFQMITPLGWLERVPTWKDSEEDSKKNDSHNLGRFGYPVLQTADIAVFGGKMVPVGKDQVSHLELSREIIRRFNSIYNTKLVEPEPLLTETPVVAGTDGRKMSKSYGNVFNLTQEVAELKKNVNSMVTDPQRIRREDPGDPEKCSVYSYHKLFSSESDLQWAASGCRSAGIGCGDCKGRLFENANQLMSGPREKKKELLKDSKRLDSIISLGNDKARSLAGRMMSDVRKKTKLT